MADNVQETVKTDSNVAVEEPVEVYEDGGAEVVSITGDELAELRAGLMIDLDDMLMSFANRYAPVVESRRANSESAKTALANRRRWAQETLALKAFYTQTDAEEIANANDLTFTAEISVAEAVTRGRPWERTLCGKNPDLWKNCARMRRFLARVDAALTNPEPVVAPWAGYFQMRFVATAKAMYKAMENYQAKPKVKPGTRVASAWEQLKPVKALQTNIGAELKNLRETGKASQSMEYWRANVKDMHEKLTA